MLHNLGGGQGFPTRKPNSWPVGNEPDIRGCMTKGAGGSTGSRVFCFSQKDSPEKQT